MLPQLSPRSFTAATAATTVHTRLSCCGGAAVAASLGAMSSFRIRRAATAPGHSFTSTATTTATLRVSARGYVNALFRIPPQHTIPTHNAEGEEVDTELLITQVRGMFDVLKSSQLCELVHEMKGCPYYECMFTTDIIFQHWDLILPMPKFGRENRSAEVSETLRHIRACGASGDINHVLQDIKGGRASGGDFVSTTHGIFMGYGTSRTNKLSMGVLSGASAASESQGESMRSLGVEPISMLEDSPPLADIMAFSGTRTLVVSDTVHGRGAADQAFKAMPKLNFQVLRMEPGCHFLSHLCGANTCYDVLCDQDFPLSMERLGESGLNPFPVEWSEPRRLGISMRSVCLIARFARGSMGAGGYANSAGQQAASFNYNSRDTAKNARLFQGGRRRFGDQGAGPAAQLRANEIINPVRQRIPRYVAPMHRSGSITRRQ